MTHQPSRPAGRVPRRTVATGAAWAVPAVMVAGSAPAYAASSGCKITARLDGLSCVDENESTGRQHMEVVLCLTRDCGLEPVRGITQVRIEQIFDGSYDSGGTISNRSYYELGRLVPTQCVQTTFRYSNIGDIPQSLKIQVRIIEDYYGPARTTRYQTLTLAAPTKVCC